jgi:oxalate decarboxylase/phosphoglucose isomerase-like protein (cupin superfamily)
LRAWDFVHCPPGTEHIFVGAGDQPCVIFMAGARALRGSAVYPRSEAALRNGAGAEGETSDSAQAYARFPKWRPGPPPSFDGLPFG